MPWVDTGIIIIVLAGAYIGYCKGFIGCLKGIIGSITGLIVAWITKPLAMAWLDANWGLEAKLALFLRESLPQEMEGLIQGLGEAANTLQELKDSLLTLPLPEEVIRYLNQALQGSSGDPVNTETIVENLTLDISQAIIGAIVFLLIWWIVSFLVRWILGLFTGGDGFSLFGIVDGLLGLCAFTVIEIAGLTLLSGALYPPALLASLSGSAPGWQQLIYNSGLMRYLAGIYQLYIQPLLG